MTREKVEAAGLHWHQEADAERLAESLGRRVADCLQARLAEQGRASLVVSGGSTPAPVLRYLSGVDIDWTNVTVTLADERWVPPGHKDSNDSLVRDTLLQNRAASAGFVPLYTEQASGEQALALVSERLSVMHHPFTVVMLGMGGDGHTASLFPDAPDDQLLPAMALDNPQRVAFLHPPSVSQARITLTRACLLQSEHRFLHLTGEGKREVLDEALTASAGSQWQPGQAPIIGLLTTEPSQAAVFWSP